MADYIDNVKPISCKNTTLKKKPCQVRIDKSCAVNFVLKRSQLSPVSRKNKRKFLASRVLDLHGLNQDSAFSAVVSFFARCQADGVRNVIVITGGNALRNTVLRMAFRRWVSDSLGDFVVSYSQADIKNGGEGAFYVILKHKK